MAAFKVQVGLRLEEEAYQKVKAISKAEHRSINNLVEYAVLLYIRDYEAQHGPVETPEEED